MDISDIINPLNDEQREAVTAKAHNQLILAGAGSGKTRVLVHRIAYLLRTQQTSGFNIMAVTFTNKAAKELKSRIEAMVQDQSYGIWIGTFHGLSLKILKQHHELAKLNPNFQIIDPDDQLKMIKRIHKDMHLDEHEFTPKKSQYFINQKKDEGIRPDDVDPEDNYFVKTVTKVYFEYEKLCQLTQCVDFSELLLRAFEVLNSNPDVLSRYQQRFRFIFVDEFQDTNSLQYRWLKLLSSDTNTLMAVGDDDQSIYSWRGAQIENMFAFKDDFKDVQEIKLEQNYRSTPTILKAANSLIQHNEDRMGKELWSQNTEGELIHLYNAFNENDEARYIAENIKHYHEQGLDLSQFAILYRSNAQSRVLEEHMNRHNLPYRVYGGMRFFERQEIKDTIAYLSLSLNPQNDFAFERVVNTPTRGIGNATLASIRVLAKENNQSLWEASAHALEHKLLSTRAGNALSQFISLIRRLEWRNDQTVLEHCEQVIELSGLKDHYRALPKQQAETKIENMDELLNAIRSFDPTQQNSGEQLAEFLSYASLDNIETNHPNQHCIQMMTLHSAKGLEFDYVFMVGMEEDLFPHQMSQVSHRNVEEERRLCYVGMTRAMQRLFMTYAEVRRIHGQERYQRASRFIHEIPRDLVHYVRQPHHQGAALSAPTKQYQLGQRVFHEQLGEGVVLNYEEDGDNSRIQIKFYDHGVKWLLCQYAKINSLS